MKCNSAYGCTWNILTVLRLDCTHRAVTESIVVLRQPVVDNVVSSEALAISIESQRGSGEAILRIGRGIMQKYNVTTFAGFSKSSQSD